MEQHRHRDVDSSGSRYDQSYYQEHCGGIPYNRQEPHWLKFFGRVADNVIRRVQPKTSFDLGCAKGFLVEALRDRGVEAYGVDISQYAISQVRDDIRPFCKVGLVTDPLERQYDVITCIEVLEHVTEDEAKVAVRNITESTRRILFSSTPNDFDEPTHVNVRPVIYWLEMFAERRFYPELSVDAGFLLPWAFFLRKGGPPATSEILRHIARVTDLKIELNEKSRKLAQLEGSVNLQQGTGRRDHAWSSRLKNTPYWRVLTGNGWVKGARHWLREARRSASVRGSTRDRDEGLRESRTNRDPQYGSWITKAEPTADELSTMAVDCRSWSYRPKISLITPVYNTDRYALIQCIESVMRQAYDRWELCLVDGGSTQEHVKEILRGYADRDARVRFVGLPKNRGIAGNSNEALNMASGDYVGLLDHDDTLSPVALYEVVKRLNVEPDIDVIYSDEDKIAAGNDTRYQPFFKPDWSPDLFLSYNYICHFAVIRRAIVERVGRFREGYDGAQDYDLFLRILQVTDRIAHIPKVLYHWRAAQGSVASNSMAKPGALSAAKRAIGEYLAARGIEADVVDGKFPTSYRIQYRLSGHPAVTIIIPTRGQVNRLKRCVSSIIDKTAYKAFDVLIVETRPREQATHDALSVLNEHPRVRTMTYGKPFDLSAVNNWAARSVTTDYLLFLHDDTEVISPEWLSAMLEVAQREDVGAVGAKLYYPDDTVQHAGMVVGLHGVAASAHHGFPRSSNGYIGRLGVIQNVSAVTGACLMVRRTVFEAVGGFEETVVAQFSDVDLCLRIREKGYLIVFTPYAELYHHRAARGATEGGGERGARDHQDHGLLATRWKQILETGDPYYSPNLTLDKDDFSIRT